MMSKITFTIDILVPTFTLVLIMVCIVGATIGINTLMKGRVINFLLNRKLLLVIASIISALFIYAFVMSISYMNWRDFFWFAYSIAVIFTVAHYTPSLVSYLMDIHQHNLEDAKEQALREAE